MRFDKKLFLSAFKQHLDQTRGLVLKNKTDNAIDTIRVFRAIDFACEEQPKCFPLNGESFWRGEGGSEFLCDYTYQNEEHRVLLALESEWGKANSPKKTIEEVIFDFKKVVNMAAPIKIMVFAYTSDSNKSDCLGAMQEFLWVWPEDAIGTLLAISCPWDDEMYSDSVEGHFWKKGKWVTI